MDEEIVLIAAARIPAITRPRSPLGRCSSTKRPKISFDGVVAGASCAAQIAVPTNRKSRNCPMTTTPDPISATRASRSERVARSRCTIRWSVPCEAAESRAPPSESAEQRVRRGEREGRIEDAQLAGLAGHRERLAESAANDEAIQRAAIPPPR